MCLYSSSNIIRVPVTVVTWAFGIRLPAKGRLVHVGKEEKEALVNRLVEDPGSR